MKNESHQKLTRLVVKLIHKSYNKKIVSHAFI